MINPTDDDIGRRVAYRAGHPDAAREDGVITSFNEHVVFVRYLNQHPTSPGTPTSRSDLAWLSRFNRKVPVIE